MDEFPHVRRDEALQEGGVAERHIGALHLYLVRLPYHCSSIVPQTCESVLVSDAKGEEKEKQDSPKRKTKFQLSSAVGNVEPVQECRRRRHTSACRRQGVLG